MIKLSDILHGHISKNITFISLYNGVFNSKECDSVKYYCDCGNPIIIHFFEDSITKCKDDNYEPIKDWGFPEICHECEEKAIKQLHRFDWARGEL